MKFISLLFTVLAVFMSVNAAPFEKRIGIAVNSINDCSSSFTNIALRFDIIYSDIYLNLGPVEINKEMATLMNDTRDANSKCCAFSTISAADADALATSITKCNMEITRGLNYLAQSKPVNYPLGSAAMVSLLDEFNRDMAGINACFIRTLPSAPKAQLDPFFTDINTAYDHAQAAYLT